MEKNAAHPEVRQEDQISSEQTDKQEGSKKRLERMQTENWRVLIGWMGGGGQTKKFSLLGSLSGFPSYFETP